MPGTPKNAVIDDRVKHSASSVDRLPISIMAANVFAEGQHKIIDICSATEIDCNLGAPLSRHAKKNSHFLFFLQ